MTQLKQLIGVLNYSKLNNDDVKTMVIAVQNQINTDVAPAWHIDPCFVVFYPDPATTSLRAYPIVIFDTPSSPECIKYQTINTGKLYACIFVDPIINSGGVILNDPFNAGAASIASALSHEVIEALIDPHMNKWAIGQYTNCGNMYAFDACDPVSSSSYKIRVGTKDVAVSNFLLPNWFDVDTSMPIDFLGVLSAPFTYAENGYALIKNEHNEYSLCSELQFNDDSFHKTSRTGRRIKELTPAHKKPWWKYLF